MKTPEKYHVMSVTPRQQAVLRLLLFNLYCNFIQKTMNSIVINQKEANFLDLVDSKTQLIIDNFAKYDEFTDVFCHRGQIAGAKTKLTTFTKEAMKNISLAIKTYNEPVIYLSQSDIDYISGDIKKIEDLVAESSLYSYTEDEIKREMNS